jgi:hypothetical protein
LLAEKRHMVGSPCRYFLAVCAALCATLVFASAAAAATLPPRGATSYKWLRVGCSETDNGYRSTGGIKTWVNRIPRADRSYYQKVKVQIDRLAGYGGSSWRKVAAKTWKWEPFSRYNLPTYSSSAVRTGLQPDSGTLTAKATVWIKEVGSLRSTWKYTVRSKSFTCVDPNLTPGGF